MANVVHKYALHLTVLQEIDTHLGMRPLSLQVQNDTLTLWGLVQPTRKKARRKVYIVGTGHEISVSLDHFEYAGTVQISDYVRHVFLGKDGV